MSSAHARLSSSRSLQSPKIAWYVLRECAVYFSIALFTFTGVLLTVRMLRFASLVINRGVEFSQIGTVFLALIPTFLEIAIPLATLLGVMLAIARLSGDSEIIVLRAAGVSIYQLVIPVLLFGVLTAVATLGISLYARPYGFQLLQNTLFEIARTRSTASLSPGIFNNMGNLTIYADKIDSHSGMLQRVLIDDRRAADTRKVIVAQRGKVISNLEEREIQLYLEDGEMHENLANGHYGITHFDQNSVAMDTDELRDPEVMRQVRHLFGAGVFGENEWIDRSRLARMVFEDSPAGRITLDGGTPLQDGFNASQVLGVKPVSTGDKGVVHVRTELVNQDDVVVCAFQRKALPTRRPCGARSKARSGRARAPSKTSRCSARSARIRAIARAAIERPRCSKKKSRAAERWRERW